MWEFSMLLRNLSLVVAILLASLAVHAEETVERKPGPYDKLITKMVARMLTQQHYAHPEIDDTASEAIFEEYFLALDPGKFYFLKEDIDAFEGYRLLLDDHVKQGELTFAFAVYEQFLKRLEERIVYAKKRIKEPFDYTIDESMAVDREDAPWATTTKELDDLWRKQLKNRMLIDTLRKEVIDEKDDDEDSEIAKSMSTEERIIKRYDYMRTKYVGNSTPDVLEIFLTTVSKVFDPHSVYWSSKSLEDFTIQMSQKLRGIGATLQDDNGYTKVVSLVPGGPADQQGQLKPDDLIIAVSQDGGEPVRVIDMPLDRVVQLIRGEIDTKVTLTVMSGLADKPRDVTITRDEVKLEESRASSEVKDFTRPDGSVLKVGVIDLPSFYADFEGQRRGDKDAASTSGDIRKLIDEMVSKDKIQGVIIDLRSNGGGSLIEAIKLSGLFIPEGPVVQQRQRLPARGVSGVEWRLRTKVHKDNDNFFYDLPLVVMTNRLSASASEIFAGCIQDYGRGVIVGDNTTHGKGTVQTIADLKDRYPLLSKVKPGAVKYTMGKFYRATGASTQQKGVIPDVIFPSFLEHMDLGEARLKHVMKWDEIPSQKIAKYENGVSQYVNDLRNRSEQRRGANEKFRLLAEDIERYGKRQEELKSISLHKDKRKVLIEEDREWSKKREAILGADRRDSKKDDDKGEGAVAEDGDADDKKEEDDMPDLYLDEAVAITGDLIALTSGEIKVTAKAIEIPTAK
jgi:carboxyl-terminal processing protease